MILVTDAIGMVKWDLLSRDATLVGDITMPIGIDLANRNIWTCAQTFAPSTEVVCVVVRGTSAGSQEEQGFRTFYFKSQ
jgi:hypothetical protein